MTCCNPTEDVHVHCECTKCERRQDWMRALKEDVIEGEYGYEEGEFDFFPQLWQPLYDEGLTPSQAFRRALDAHAEARSP